MTRVRDPAGDGLGPLRDPSGGRFEHAGPRLGRYALGDELGRGCTGVVYEALDTESGAVVALKTLAWMDAENLFRLKHEFRSLANLEHDNFVRFGELACHEGQWFFTMERIGGEDFLSHVTATDALETGVKLRSQPAEASAEFKANEKRLRAVLAQLVEGVAALHEAGRLHRDLKPSNVFVTPEGRVVLLDFGLMSGFGLDKRISGTPGYMAPEQVVCGALTPASDWYAVGVMLFVAMTGRLPFDGETTDIMSEKLVAETPTDWGSGCPEDLRALCAALLQREPTARPDILDIRSRLDLVAPARGPMGEVFVGRKMELEGLAQAFARAQSGASQIVVRGEPGIGKSALVERFLADLPARTLVLRGRCYEQESIPFGGIDALMDALSEHLSDLEEDEVGALVAGGASNVARIFPVLCRVPLIAAQATNRGVENPAKLRELAMGELARLMTALGRAQPLVVYVDDLQWADSDSLALLRGVLPAGPAQRGHCLFIATLRSNARLSTEIAKFVEDIESIEVGALSDEESLALCRALGAGESGAASSAALQDAAGHPLFLSELLHSARVGQMPESGAARLEDVLWRRIAARDDIERRFLEATALGGAPLPYTVLARAAGLDVGECLTRLSGLRAAQLVRVSRLDHARCVEPYHDRIREAIVEHLRSRGATAIGELHLQLGRALRESTRDAALPSRIFSIVQHYDLGRAHVTSEHEMTRLAELNLLASREARLATAYDRATEYARIGIECAGEDGWTRCRLLYRDLHLALLESTYLGGYRDVALATFEIVRSHTHGPEELASLHVPWIRLETGKGQMREALAAGRKVLGELGIRVPVRATLGHVLYSYAAARRAQKGRPADVLRSLPRLSDPATESTMRLLVALAPAAFFAEANLMPWLMLTIARVSMSRGLSDGSSFGFAGYGMVLAAAFKKYPEAASFGRLAVALADPERDPAAAARTHFMSATFIEPWVSDVAATARSLRTVERLAQKGGDTTYEVYAVVCAAIQAFSGGVDLGATQAVAERGRDAAVRGKEDALVGVADAIARYASALRGLVPSRLTERAAAGADPDPFASWSHNRQSMAVCIGRTNQAELAYLADDVGLAEEHLAEARLHQHAVFGAVYMADACFVGALVAARRCDEAPIARRIRLVAAVVRSLRSLETWGRSCPRNFEPQALVVRAELARILGRSAAATLAYDRAIRSARAHEAPKREAIACELAARHAGSVGSADTARAYRERAVDAYRRWGAVAKAEALENAHRQRGVSLAP
jgi:predicted ATPase